MNAGESEGVTLQELIESIEDLYRSLLESGYRINDIDNMDIFYFLYLMDKEGKEEKTKLTPIDLVW